MDKLAEVSYWGLALEADRVCLGAGIAALEGRTVDVLAGYREALRAYRQLGLAFDEALAGIDMAILLGPSEREAADVAAAIATARETLTRLGAAPFLARLEAAVAGGSQPALREAEPGRSAAVTRVRSGSA
jgi:hypothetical protein